MEEVVKGGIRWFEMSIERGKGGLVFYIKADPRLEEFMRGLTQMAPETIEAYGKTWHSVDPEKQLSIYHITKTLKPSATYQLGIPAADLLNSKDGKVNLSFLQFVGIGGPEGVTFVVEGPYSKGYVLDYRTKVLSEVRNLLKDYVVPIHINLRISSQEI